MDFDELFGANPEPLAVEAPPPSRWPDFLTFCDALQRRGFRLIGSGWYSRVYGKAGSSRVIKVCKTLDGWQDYVVWAAQRGYLGKQAPNVTSLKIIEAVDGHRFYVAVCERLACEVRSKPEAYATYKQIVWSYDAFQRPHVLPDEWKGFVADFEASFPYGRDMHAGNWMVRDDGSICLNDPLTDASQTNQKSPSRLRSRDLASLRMAA